MGQQLNFLRDFNINIAAMAATGAIKEILLTMLHKNSIDTSEDEIKNYANEILDIFTKGILKEGTALP